MRTIPLARTAVLAIASAIALTTLTAVPATAEPAKTVRVSGEDRYATSVAISKRTFTKPADVRGVVIASGANFADALAGGPLARTQGGPVLLTNGKKLTPGVKSELQRFSSLQNIYIAGGTGAVSKSVERELSRYAKVTRVGGIDRYETSRKIAPLVCPTNCSEVMIVDGFGFADSLSASVRATTAPGVPILLIPGRKPHQDETRQLLRQMGAPFAWLVGGTGVITRNAAVSLAAPNARLGGADRYETNQLVNAKFGSKDGTVYLASGADFPDAISAAAALARTSGALVLTPPRALAPATKRALGALKGAPAVVAGGPGAVSSSTMRAADRILHPAPPTTAPLKRIDAADYFTQELTRKAPAAGAYQLDEYDTYNALPTESMKLTPLQALPAGVTATYEWTRDGQPIAAPAGQRLTVTGSDVGHKFQAEIVLSGSGYETSARSFQTITVVADPTISMTEWRSAYRARFAELLNQARVSAGEAPLGPLTTTDWIQRGENDWVQYLVDNRLPLAHSDRAWWEKYWPEGSAMDPNVKGKGENMARGGASVKYASTETAIATANAAFNLWSTSPQHNTYMMAGNNGKVRAHWSAVAVDWATGTPTMSFTWG